MEKISVRLLVLAAAMIAPNLLGSENQVVQVKHAEEINAEELKATTRAQQYCAYAESDLDETA